MVALKRQPLRPVVEGANTVNCRSIRIVPGNGDLHSGGVIRDGRGISESGIRLTHFLINFLIGQSTGVAEDRRQRSKGLEQRETSGYIAHALFYSISIKPFN